jgi:hypothetical protein
MSFLFVGANADDMLGQAITDDGSEARVSNYCQEQIVQLTSNNCTAPLIFPLSDTSDDMWFHARFRPNEEFDWVAAWGELITFYDSDWNEIAKLDLWRGKTQAKAYGTTNVYSAVFTMMPLSTYTLDIHVEVLEASIRIRIYLDGSKVADATATKNGQGSIANVVATADQNSSGNLANLPYLGSYEQYWSEIIITDTDDTRGMRLVELKPDGNGGETDFSGGYTNILEADSGQITGENADVQTWNLSGYSATETEILAVISKSVVYKGPNSASTVKQILRIGTTNYEGASVSAQGIIQEVWETNPDDDEAWSVSDLTNLQAGVISEADIDYSGLTSYQYWRVLCLENENTTYYGIGELEFRNTVGGSDIATEGNAIAGSERASFPKENAFDGVTGGTNSWSTEKANGADCWIGQNFGTDEEILEIMIKARGANPGQAPREFKVQGSVDGVTWYDKLSVTGEPNWSSNEERTFEIV